MSDDLSQCIVKMKGCPNSIYQNQIIELKVDFPADYPFKPPRFKSNTKLWHPNIF